MLLTYDKVPEEKDAIKAQLKFRRDMLHQIPKDKSLYSLSKKSESKRKQLTVDELKENLKLLVHDAAVNTRAEERHMLVGKRVRYIQVEVNRGKQERKAYLGKIVSQVRFTQWVLIVVAYNT